MVKWLRGEFQRGTSFPGSITNNLDSILLILAPAVTNLGTEKISFKKTSCPGHARLFFLYPRPPRASRRQARSTPTLTRCASRFDQPPIYFALFSPSLASRVSLVVSVGC